MRTRSTVDRQPAAGLDPLDRRLEAAVPVVLERRRSGWSAIASWSATSVPVALLLLGGIVLGPRGADVLSQRVLAFLDPVIPVALAALGVLAGLTAGLGGPGGRRVLALAAFDTGIAVVLVGAGMALVASAAGVIPTIPLWTFALIAGLSAAVSMPLPTGSPTDSIVVGPRVVEVSALLSILAGGLLLAALREGSLVGSMLLVGQAGLVVAALAVAGWLLLSRTDSDTEQRVFGVAALLLLGGAADYLSLSALAAGLIAGVCWRFAGTATGESIRRDALHVQHPMVVLVLLVAGARAELTPTAIGNATLYVFLRSAAKLISESVVGRIGAIGARDDLAARLLSPGVFGVAYVLNAVRASGPEMSDVLTIVVVGTIGSDLLWRFLRPPEAPE